MIIDIARDEATIVLAVLVNHVYNTGALPRERLILLMERAKAQNPPDREMDKEGLSATYKILEALEKDGEKRTAN